MNTKLSIAAGIAAALASLAFAAPAFAASVPVGNPAISRATTDTFTNFTIIDTNNPVSANGTLNTFSYYAANTNSFEFVLVDAGNVVKYISPTITPAGTGPQTYNASVPVTAGWNLGVHFDSSGTIPFDSSGAAATYTADNSGTPNLGDTLAGGTTNRTYSWNANHATTLIVDDNLACPGAMYSTIQAAVNAANSGDTIQVCAGTYTEVGQIVINKDLTIIGADKTTTIIRPAQDTGNSGSGDARGWFLTVPGITFNMSGVTLDGAGKNICHGIYDYSLGTIQDVNVKNIGCEQYYGRAIYLKNNATVRNVRFENIARIGVFVWQGATAAVIDGNTYVGKGAGDHLDYGIELENGAVATLTNNTISGNTGVASIDRSTSAGILVTTYIGPGTQATIIGNTLTNNTDGIAVGYDGTDTSVVTAHRNNISGNSASGVTSTNPAVNASCNWWGSATGPGPVGPGSGDKISTNVSASTWLTTSDLNGPCDGPLPPAPGSIEITKYACPADTVVTRAANGVGGTAPSECVPQSGATFGYVHGTASDANGPYPELPANGGVITEAGATGGSGVLTISNLPSTGRYLVVETDGQTNQLPFPGSPVLGLYCIGDGDTSGNNDNQELTFVPAGGTVKCVAYNKAPSATLTLVKSVTENNGGTAAATDWTLSASGPTPISGTTGSAAVTNASVTPGTYDLSEAGGPSGYTPSAWECVPTNGGPPALSPDDGVASVTLANGDDVTCTITNDDQPGTLIVIKHVINDNGGQADASAFTMNVSGTNVSNPSFAGAESPGTSVTLDAGSYSVDEGAFVGYTKSLGTDCSGTIANGETKTCTITNDDIAPKLTVTKVVVNDNGGTKVVGSFHLLVDATGVTSGVQNSFNAGAHTVSETGSAGYAGTFSGACAANGTITLAPGDVKSCTLTNNDIAPKLTLNKIVINDNGLNQPESAWTISATGPTSISGPGATGSTDVQSGSTFLPGTYTLSESAGPAGYFASKWSCVKNGGSAVLGSSITLGVGDTVTCTITNDDIAPPAANACSTSQVQGGYTLQSGTIANDTVTLSSPYTMYKGNGGNDKVTAGDGYYIICLGVGNDTVTTGNGSVTIDAGGGNNTIKTGTGNGYITSGVGNDSITTGTGTHTIDAGGGENTIVTGDGNQTVTTGVGNDKITTGGGNDTINAGGGNNTVKAGAGNDTVTTGVGNDNIDGGFGTDICNAGGGVNILTSCNP